jgi:hypothetical protein
MKQFVLTVAAGKRLIARALAVHPVIKSALKQGTIVVIAGTTNGYVAEELLAVIGREKGFTMKGFYRGITLPPGFKITNAGRVADESGFPGDVVIKDGVWQKGKTIGDVADGLKEGDVILKGANALDLVHRRAAVLVGSPQGGTITVSLQAVIGRRVRLIVPVGLEKRIDGDFDDVARRMNAPGAEGARFLPVPGEVFTELEALALLAGVRAELIAAGGVAGAEGSVRLAVSGAAARETAAARLLKSIAAEPAFTLP